jgi:hypothetical protein
VGPLSEGQDYASKTEVMPKPITSLSSTNSAPGNINDNTPVAKAAATGSKAIKESPAIEHDRQIKAAYARADELISKSGFNRKVIDNQVRERLTSFGYEREEVDSLVGSGGKNTGIPNMPTMTIPSSSRSSAMSGSLPPVSASASASAVPMNPMTEEMRKSFREIKPEDVATIDFSKMDYGAISKMFGEGFAEVAKTAVKIALEEVHKSRQ